MENLTDLTIRLLRLKEVEKYLKRMIGSIERAMKTLITRNGCERFVDVLPPDSFKEYSEMVDCIDEDIRVLKLYLERVKNIGREKDHKQVKKVSREVGKKQDHKKPRGSNRRLSCSEGRSEGT